MGGKFGKQESLQAASPYELLLETQQTDLNSIVVDPLIFCSLSKTTNNLVFGQSLPNEKPTGSVDQAIVYLVNSGKTQCILCYLQRVQHGCSWFVHEFFSKV